MEYRRLGRTDLRVSVLGFGGAPLVMFMAHVIRKNANAPPTCHRSGNEFLRFSPYYGFTLSEESLGDALREREQIMLATKCGRYGLNEFDFSAKRVMASVDESLKRLKTDYINLFRVHDVEFGEFRQIIDENVLPCESSATGKAVSALPVIR